MGLQRGRIAAATVSIVAKNNSCKYKTTSLKIVNNRHIMTVVLELTSVV